MNGDLCAHCGAPDFEAEWVCRACGWPWPYETHSHVRTEGSEIVAVECTDPECPMRLEPANAPVGGREELSKEK